MAPNGRMINEQLIWMFLEESSHELIKVIFCHLSGVTDKNNRKAQYA
jgi:hypothetical protein